MKTEKKQTGKPNTLVVKKLSLTLKSLSGSGMNLCARYLKRGSWLSLQYYELGSLINLYLKIIETKDPQASKAKLERFVKTALRVLHGYRFSVYRRFKKEISSGRRGVLSLTSLHGAMGGVYEELRSVARLYDRMRQWKEVFDGMASLIRETFGR
jgi:hypothetical protein